MYIGEYDGQTFTSISLQGLKSKLTRSVGPYETHQIVLITNPKGKQYTIRRINKIYPNGMVKVGRWY